MSLLALLPVLMPQLPPAAISIGMKLMQHPGIVGPNGSIDSDAIITALPHIAKDDPEIAKFGAKVALRGLGVQPAAADLALDYIFATEGQRDDKERDEFVKKFAQLNSPQGIIYSKLPYGCKECRRIHYTSEDVKLDANNKPLCIRCGRIINV